MHTDHALSAMENLARSGSVSDWLDRMVGELISRSQLRDRTHHGCYILVDRRVAGYHRMLCTPGLPRLDTGSRLHGVTVVVGDYPTPVTVGVMGGETMASFDPRSYTTDSIAETEIVPHLAYVLSDPPTSRRYAVQVAEISWLAAQLPTCVSRAMEYVQTLSMIPWANYRDDRLVWDRNCWITPRLNRRYHRALVARDRITLPDVARVARDDVARLGSHREFERENGEELSRRPRTLALLRRFVADDWGDATTRPSESGPPAQPPAPTPDLVQRVVQPVGRRGVPSMRRRRLRICE